MKQVFVILLLLGAVTAASAQRDSLDAKIVRLLEVSGAQGQFLSAIDNLIALQRQSPSERQLTDDFWDEFSQELHQEGWADIQPRLLEIYHDNYTEEEIDFQIAYFADPIAQGIQEKQAVIMQQSMAVGAAWGQAIGEKIGRKLAEAKENKN